MLQAIRAISMKTTITITTIVGAALFAQVALGQRPHSDGVPGGDSSRDRGDEIDCASFVTGTVTVAPPTIEVGHSAVLSWSVSVPDRCSAKGITLGGEPVGKQGSMTIHPPRTRSYELKQDANTLSTTHIGLGYPPVVVIDPSTSEPVEVLIGALTDSTNLVQVIELSCDVDLDLTGHSRVVIGSNRSLIASPACARGPRSSGPRIHVTDKRDRNHPLFEIPDSNVRVSGFRLEGPTSDIESDKDFSAMGIRITPNGWVAGTIHDIEISNMEMSHWSGAAIGVYDSTQSEERGRLTNENVSAVHIQNNFLHHNRHYGLGYGVVVGAGGYALIEQNVFDENRHAIAGDSRNGMDYSGYTARDNLILAGGGLHCSFSAQGVPFPTPVCWQTHQIDMHGDKSSHLNGAWCCGTAGETMMIERNTILYTNGIAIKIRGNPADKAVVDGNAFKHKKMTDAISQNGNPGIIDTIITNPIDVRPNNVFNFDPSAELGSCDFVGDGNQDKFMASGVTWWAKSATTLQWRYLNTMPGRLPELQLGDVDNDGKCDVASRSTTGARTYSHNGTEPWVLSM